MDTPQVRVADPYDLPVKLFDRLTKYVDELMDSSNLLDGAPRFKNGQTLSELASAIAGERAFELVGYEDVHAHDAPSECNGLVAKRADERVGKLLLAAGVADEEQLNQLIFERTSSKWAYFGWQGLIGRIADRESPFRD